MHEFTASYNMGEWFALSENDWKQKKKYFIIYFSIEF